MACRNSEIDEDYMVDDVTLSCCLAPGSDASHKIAGELGVAGCTQVWLVSDGHVWLKTRLAATNCAKSDLLPCPEDHICYETGSGNDVMLRRRDCSSQ